MDFWRSLGGMVELKITDADTSGLLTALGASGVVLENTRVYPEELAVTVQIKRRDYKKVSTLGKRRGSKISLLHRNGMYWTGKGLIKRPVFLIGMSFLLLLVCFLPTRIFFFEIEGNETVPTRLILEKCMQSGISFGASRREVRSEKVKNTLLEAIPQLQWAGVNTVGCRAIISVRERSQPQTPGTNTGVSSIVAARDGVVVECTVTRGNKLCTLGQAVKKGQTLISGYTDTGLTIRGEQAQGEVYALTKHNLSVLFPENWVQNREITRQEKKVSLIIGKNKINFFKGSGISPTECDKMYSLRYLTLPGGFQLPVAVVTEVWTYYRREGAVVEDGQKKQILSDFGKAYIASHMVAGSIIHTGEIFNSDTPVSSMLASYACKEMIGVVRYEEGFHPNGQHD